MTGFPNSPRLVKGGLVLVDPDFRHGAKNHPPAIQPRHTLNRMLQPQGIKESSDSSEALRSTGPPVETIKRDANIDSKRQLRLKPQKP